MPAWKPGQWRWMPVRHTENQQHPDWVLYYSPENDGRLSGQPRAVSECERREDGRWLWRVDVETVKGLMAATGFTVGKLETGFEPSADLAMKSATAFIKREWEGKADAQHPDL